MVNLTDLEIETAENEGAWTATSTQYPDFVGAGETEEDAKLNLVDQINADEEVNTVNEGGESTEG